MKPTPEEVVAILSEPNLQTMLSARGNAMVDIILDALYEKIEQTEAEKEAKVTEKESSKHSGYLPVRSCPRCDGDTYVIETRENDDGTIRRRRGCSLCGHRFSTMEIFYNYKKKSLWEV